jgi:hypothetical protein
MITVESDEFTVPLRRGHHREVHRCGDEAAWWKNTGVDPTIAARALRLGKAKRPRGQPLRRHWASGQMAWRGRALVPVRPAVKRARHPAVSGRHFQHSVMMWPPQVLRHLR